MSSTRLGPIKDMSGKVVTPGTIYYHIENQPSKTDFDGTTARIQMRQALDCWERSTAFKFVEMPSQPDPQQKYFPRITFTFGTPTSVLHAAETTFVNKVDDGTAGRQILFNDAFTWASMREKVTPVNALFAPSPSTAAPFVDDLWTVTMHEVGHALGLDDVKDTDSIMYWMDVQDNANAPVMVGNAIPVRDAIDIAEMYVLPDQPVENPPEIDGGYAIIGGKFMMWESDAKDTHPQTPLETEWGIHEGWLVRAGSGYCISPTIGTGRRGWGELYFYLRPAAAVGKKDLVATGGYQMNAAPSFQFSQPGHPAPTLLTCVPKPGGRIVGGVNGSRRWGGDWGYPDGGADHAIAHFWSENTYPGTMGYRVMFLDLKNVGPDGIRVSGGLQRPANDPPQSPPSWGVAQQAFSNIEIGRADSKSPGGATYLTLWAQARKPA